MADSRSDRTLTTADSQLKKERLLTHIFKYFSTFDLFFDVLVGDCQAHQRGLNDVMIALIESRSSDDLFPLNQFFFQFFKLSS
ncbi:MULTISPECIES: hypothetical protein [unclassified Endozoicomonas]|uniref:hypothetical protein n=1 Tax=unclassified Endozoicomonas TaxID=2644528 RepID=UPI00214804FD|nr:MULTISPECIES: hypothetical protein [unclassified Endozoicomonas]